MREPWKLMLIPMLAMVGCGGTAAPSGSSSAPANDRLVTGNAAVTAVDAAEIADPAADALTRDEAEAPGYVDIVNGTVRRAPDGSFVFVVTVAAPVPASPRLPADAAALGWSACVDVIPMVATTLFGQVVVGGPCQFIVRTYWDGHRFGGQLLDRRLVGADEPTRVRPVEPLIAGSRIRMTVPAEALGNPARFFWSMETEELEVGDWWTLGPSAGTHMDAAPDGGVGAPVAWPRD
jgi:hypothetical protein